MLPLALIPPVHTAYTVPIGISFCAKNNKMHKLTHTTTSYHYSFLALE